MQRMSIVAAACAAAVIALVIGPSAYAQSKSKEPAASDGLLQNVISVSVPSRHGEFATGNCLVWANAEGLGVGPSELAGFHGVNMNINVAPLPNEDQRGTSFDIGVKTLMAQYPTTPPWLLNTIQKNRSAIEAACRVDHPEPFIVYRITEKDKHN